MEKTLVTPDSPGVSLIKLSDCLENLLLFILQSSTLDFPLDFCSTLLQVDHNHDFSQGVPQHDPLYKTLASSLLQWIVSGSMLETSQEMASQSEDESLKEMKEKWNGLVLQKGSELMDMLKTIKFELHVQEPYFTQLKDGVKTVEGRCAVGNYNRMQSGDMVFFNKCLMLEVQEIRHYSSFFEMLEAESLDNVLPGVLTIEEGVQIYRKFYTKEKEQINGVLAISVRRPTYQPYMIVSDIISELGYRGIQSLLGLKQTVGTIPEVLLASPTSSLSS